MKKYTIFLSVFLIYVIINMVIAPKFYISTTYNGILAWAINVLPSILPFVVFIKLLSSFGGIEKCASIFARPCKKLFNCPSYCAFVFLTSILSGYPVGGVITADLYNNGKITRSEAFRMCSFCSTSGPMFIIGAVGTSMLRNSKIGYIVFVSHIIGAFLNGILYRKLTVPELPIKTPQQQKQSSNSFQVIIQDSVLSILSVGAIIAVFFVIIASLSPLFNLFPPQISCILEGLIEITKGCMNIGTNLKGASQLLAVTFVISFGGLSTIFQSMSILDKVKIPMKLLLLQKTTHALLAMGSSFVLCLIFL